MAEHPLFCYPLARYLTVTQPFWASHLGLDFGWNSSVQGGCNQGILSVAAGTVVAAVDGYANTYPNTPRFYGNYVILNHGGGWFSLYGHLLKGLKVKTGDTVRQGQTLGYMGNSGYSNGQHLHFELRKGGNSKAFAVDPMPFLLIMPTIANLIVSKSTLLPGEILYFETVKAVGTPVARDTGRDQLEITAAVVNGRLYPRLDGSRWGYIKAGIYNIHDRVEADGYVWYQLAPDVNGVGDALWAAYSAGWAVLYLAGAESGEAETERLKGALAAAQARAAAAEDTLDRIRALVAS